MKVFLVDLVHNQIVGDNQISGGEDFIVPLNIARIASFITNNIQSAIDISIFKYPDDLLQAVEKDNPDIIGFSNYIWNKDLNFKIGSFIKQLYPEIIIVMGGPSIRQDNAGIKNFLKGSPFVDMYIMFEGEKPFLDFLNKFEIEGKKLLEYDSDLYGCAQLIDDKLIYRPVDQKVNITELTSPYLNGRLDKFLEKGLIPLFETNRGCPHRCSFCVWGISSFNRVRKFSLQTIYEEMDYVARKYPDLSAWIIADANFGIFERDIEIAKKIKFYKDQNPALSTIILWESLNTSKRNVEIAKIIGDDTGNFLIAVQTLDTTAQKNINRKNINLEKVKAKIESFHANDQLVKTHVLVGLPGESYESHLDTLRKCFSIGFDEVQIFSTILLPGSDMESQLSRDTYGIKTKFRLRQGGYGEYQGIISIDCEEIIQSSSSINESEMRYLRIVHWLVWYGWNHKFLKPIWKYAQKENNINPVDIILEILKVNSTTYPNLVKLFSDFFEDAKSEWFERSECLYEHYSLPENWNLIMNNGFSKVEFKYTAIMIFNNVLFKELLEANLEIIHRRIPTIEIDIIVNVVHEMRIEPNSFFDNFVGEKSIQIPARLVPYFFNNIKLDYSNKINNIGLQLSKPSKEVEEIRTNLVRYGYLTNNRYAIEKTLGTIPNGFVYNVELAL